MLTSSEIRILAFDPGGTTGYAIANIQEGIIVKVGCNQQRLMCSGLYAILNDYRPEYIVCESFSYRNASREGLDLTAPKLIGVMELYAEMNCCHLKMQPPSVQGRGAFWTDKRLRDADLYIPGKEHSRSAVKHLLYFLTFKKGSTLWHDAENRFLAHFAAQQT